MIDRPGRGLADALAAHRTLRDYRIVHGGKRVEGAQLKAHGGDVYLLLDRREEHFYVKRQALGVDTWVLEDAVARGARSVVIVYHGRTGRTVYRAPMAAWRSRAFRVRYEGFDEQTQLPVGAMEILAADGIRDWGVIFAPVRL